MDNMDTNVSNEKKLCKKCGSELSPGAKFCRKCGEEWLPEFKKELTCPKCGAENPDDSTYCESCGSKIHEAVDLGLSVKWATCNVELTDGKNMLFGWADPTGEKDSGVYSDIDICRTRYDMARANWGGNWRLPTKKECEELISKCKLSWKDEVMQKGMEVVGPNGKSIFLPAEGFRYHAEKKRVGELCNYWSGTLNENTPCHAFCLELDSNQSTLTICQNFYGLSVRPVQD